MTEATLKVHLPKVPNFLRVDGLKGSIPLSVIPDDQLRALGAEWTDRLIERAQEQRRESVGIVSD